MCNRYFIASALVAQTMFQQQCQPAEVQVQYDVRSLRREYNEGLVGMVGMVIPRIGGACLYSRQVE